MLRVIAGWIVTLFLVLAFLAIIAFTVAIWG